MAKVPSSIAPILPNLAGSAYSTGPVGSDSNLPNIKRIDLNTVTSDRELVPEMAVSGRYSFRPGHKNYARSQSLSYAKAFGSPFNVEKDCMPWGDSEQGAAITKQIDYFWKEARAGRVREVFRELGNIDYMRRFRAPIAVYEMNGYGYEGQKLYVLIQHGSYLILDKKDHPEIELGEITLYRGIRQKRDYYLPRLLSANEFHREFGFGGVALEYGALMFKMMSDSRTSFLAAHQNNHASETNHLIASAGALFEFARYEDMTTLEQARLKQMIRQTQNESFSTSEPVASGKFGPNYIKVSTPLTNIRICSMFTGENEAKLVYPDLASVTGQKGCQVLYMHWGDFPNMPSPYKSPSKNAFDLKAALDGQQRLHPIRVDKDETTEDWSWGDG